MRHVLLTLALACSLSYANASRADEATSRAQLVVVRAREEIARHVAYDARYVGLAYPGGDVDSSHGVCTDVVIRALRAAGIDLQRLVHEDVLRRPAAYARLVTRPDANIDHRRAGPLLVWLEAHARRLPRDVTAEASRATFAPGDVVVWSLKDDGRAEHVGVVSDRRGSRGLPLVIHNIGPEPTEDDVLDAWPMLGHFSAL